MFEVWQNLAPFSGRPIVGAVEALLTKVINRQSSVSPIVVFYVAAAVSVITQPNSAESIILCVCVCVLTWAPAREDRFAILGTFEPRCMDPPRLAS
jgi:hypothetical protein